MQNRLCRQKGKEAAHSDRDGAEKFGDLITADTFFSYDGVSEDGDVLGVVVRDAYTGWLACYPAAENSTDEAHFALNGLEKVGAFYSDCAPELMAAAKRLRWRHATSTPGRPETNGAAERAVRAVLEGARSLLAASGLPHRWWNHAAGTGVSCTT